MGETHRPHGPPPQSMILVCPHVLNAALILRGKKTTSGKSTLLGTVRFQKNTYITRELWITWIWAEWKFTEKLSWWYLAQISGKESICINFNCTRDHKHTLKWTVEQSGKCLKRCIYIYLPALRQNIAWKGLSAKETWLFKKSIPQLSWTFSIFRKYARTNWTQQPDQLTGFICQLVHCKTGLRGIWWFHIQTWLICRRL